MIQDEIFANRNILVKVKLLVIFLSYLILKIILTATILSSETRLCLSQGRLKNP